jgi:hypothetical protein
LKKQTMTPSTSPCPILPNRKKKHTLSVPGRYT